MNQKLTEQIVYHIFANLGVLPSSFVNYDVTKSVVDKQFLLPEKISFEMADGKVIRKNIYGCQISIADSKDFKLLLGDCTQEKDLPEYCLLVQLKDAPAFGIYLVFSQLSEDTIDKEALIAVNTDNKNWMPCNTYLQATFLAGMEQLRDVGSNWKKCVSYQDQYQQLLSFIKFHNNYFEASDEG